MRERGTREMRKKSWKEREGRREREEPGRRCLKARRDVATARRAEALGLGSGREWLPRRKCWKRELRTKRRSSACRHAKRARSDKEGPTPSRCRCNALPRGEEEDGKETRKGEGVGGRKKRELRADRCSSDFGAPRDERGRRERSERRVTRKAQPGRRESRAVTAARCSISR